MIDNTGWYLDMLPPLFFAIIMIGLIYFVVKAQGGKWSHLYDKVLR